MTATDLKKWSDDTFTRLENGVLIRHLPRVKKRLEEIHQAINKDIDEIAAKIPANSPWTVIADAVITWLEGKYPAWKTELEWIKALIDALFTEPPPKPA